MTDIAIYTTPEKLEHKKGADEYKKYYWNFGGKEPKDFEVGDRIYFAVEGSIVGYFTCEEFNRGKEDLIVWDKDSWFKLKKPIPCKPFQGFKYISEEVGE